MIWLLPAILGILALTSCSGEKARVTTDELRATNQTVRAPIEFAPPSPDTIPGSQLGEQIRLGYEIVVNTQEYARSYVGNRLNRTNCHLDVGLNSNAAPFVGLAALYPEYRPRSARMNTLADRVNECMERSLNGRAFPPDSSKLQAVGRLYHLALTRSAEWCNSILARPPAHRATAPSRSKQWEASVCQ